MLTFFRSFFSSKVGVVVTLLFVAIIGLAFALSSVADGGGLGPLSSGTRVASVGNQKISATDLDGQVRSILSRLRARNPQLSIKEFLATDGLNEVLSFVIDGKAVMQWGERHGIHISDRLIDSEIAKDPNVQGPDGKVDSALYRQLLAQQGTTDGAFRIEQAQQLMAQQLLGSTAVGLAVPRKLVQRYGSVESEHRIGAIVTLPQAAFAPAGPVSDADVTSWYAAHKGDYMLPERRTLRYVTYTDTAVKDVPAPTDTELAARYAAGKAKYAAADKRKLSQMVLPSEAAARDVLAQLAAGKTLEAAAAAKGLAVAPLPGVTRDAFALQSTAEAAAAVFAAANGKVVGPFKAPLGWVLVRVDGREVIAGKTLDQVKAELLKELSVEKRREAITEFSARIEGEIDNGASLGDVAKQLGVQVIETPALTAGGTVFGPAGGAAPAAIAKVVPAAFQMDGSGNPQLAEVETGKTFVIFDVGTIAPAAPPPLAQIRDQVSEDARINKGAAAAKAAADKLKAQLQKGVPVDAAVAALGVALPPVDHVDMDRLKLQQMGQNAPKPLLMVFAAAKGKVQLLQGPRNHGWYVVTVSQVTPGKVIENDPRLAGLADSLKQAQGSELGEQLRTAFRNEVGSTRNEANLRKLQTQLSGGN